MDGDKTAAKSEHRLNSGFNEGVANIAYVLSQILGDVAEGISLFQVSGNIIVRVNCQGEQVTV